MKEYKFVCKTCKKEYILGYTGYIKRIKKNQSFDECYNCILRKNAKERNKEKYINTCKICGKEFSINKTGYNTRIKLNKSMDVCYSCNQKNNKKNKKYSFKCNICDENFSLGIDGYSKRIKLQIPIDICTKCLQSQNTKTQLSNMSFEEKEIRKLKIAKASKKMHENMSEEEKKIRKEQSSIFSKRAWSNYTYEEYKERCEKQKRSSRNFWDNITKFEFQEKCKLQAIEHNKNLDKYIPSTTTEREFADYLDNIHILYKCQYQNTSVDEFFNEIFPYNYIDDTELINPHHRWDFIIYGKNNSILIDIDGGKHNISDINIIGAKIKFNDSQRPYQTDGLDAYIIEAYDDKLDNDTKVLHIKNNKPIEKSNEYISYKEFINYLMILDKSIK